jgi:hypothetical protein
MIALDKGYKELALLLLENNNIVIDCAFLDWKKIKMFENGENLDFIILIIQKLKNTLNFKDEVFKKICVIISLLLSLLLIYFCQAIIITFINIFNYFSYIFIIIINITHHYCLLLLLLLL